MKSTKIKSIPYRLIIVITVLTLIITSLGIPNLSLFKVSAAQNHMVVGLFEVCI
jgi:hypothetical protein